MGLWISPREEDLRRDPLTIAPEALLARRPAVAELADLAEGQPSPKVLDEGCFCPKECGDCTENLTGMPGAARGYCGTPRWKESIGIANKRWKLGIECYPGRPDPSRSLAEFCAEARQDLLASVPPAHRADATQRLKRICQ